MKMDSGPPIFARRRSRSPLPFTPTTWRPTGDWADAVHHGSGAGPGSGGGSGVCGAGGRLWNRLPGCHANRRACVNSGKLAGHTTAVPARWGERAPPRRERGGRRGSAHGAPRLRGGGEGTPASGCAWTLAHPGPRMGSNPFQPPGTWPYCIFLLPPFPQCNIQKRRTTERPC